MDFNQHFDQALCPSAYRLSDVVFGWRPLLLPALKMPRARKGPVYEIGRDWKAAQIDRSPLGQLFAIAHEAEDAAASVWGPEMLSHGIIARRPERAPIALQAAFEIEEDANKGANVAQQRYNADRSRENHEALQYAMIQQEVASRLVRHVSAKEASARRTSVQLLRSDR